MLNRKSSLLVFALLLLGGNSDAQYRNYSLRCLAPIIDNIDPNAPKTVQEAFLAGPKYLATPLSEIGKEAIEFPISTESEEAQKWFNQGIALLHVLWYEEAERAFRTVVELDPDCPMGYWGLAQASEREPQRAMIYAQAAAGKCDRNRPDIEQRWTALLTEFYAEAETVELPERSRARIKALEELHLDFPDHFETKAFLIRRLTLDQYIAGLEVTSTLAVDLMARELARENPNHPSQHYRVFLWMNRRPEHVLDTARTLPLLSPDAPQVWRYSAEAFLAAGRSTEAIPLLEAAIRADHRYFAGQDLMPWESQNLLGNYHTLVSALTQAGRVEEAINWAERALTLPHDLVSEGPVREEILVNCFLEAGLWERFLEALKENPALTASDSFSVRAWLLSRKGIAQHMLGWEKPENTALDEIEALQKEALVAGISNVEEGLIEASYQTLRKVGKAFSPSEASTSPTPLKDTELSPLVMARILERIGRGEEAYQMLEEANSNGYYQWLQTAYFSHLAWEGGHRRSALFPIDRGFRIHAGHADSELPIFSKLTPLAAALKLPEEWTLSAPVQDSPLDSDEIGPEEWQPSVAPDFSLEDRFGKTHTLTEMKGHPVMLNFFLGVRCAFCLEQFQTFQPYLEAFSERKIKTIGITIDTTETLTEVLGNDPELPEDFRDFMPFPVLSDPELEAFRTYRIFDEFENGPMHATVFVSPEGKILWRNVSHSTFQEPAALLSEARRLLKVRGNSARP